MRKLTLLLPLVLLAGGGCEPSAISQPDEISPAPPLFSFHSGTPDAVSPPDDLARNPSRSGFPHPTESDQGWGGGWDKWDIVEGVRYYSQWYNGLAFTGGTLPWIQACGWRQATINFGQPTTFNRVVVWHHALEHVPNTYKIQYWSGDQWVDVFSTTSGHDFLRFPSGSPSQWWEGWSTPTDNSFPPVTGTKVRFALNNCDIVHGWIYEFEVYLDVANEPPTADAGPDQVAECGGHLGTGVTLDGSGSRDADGELVAYEWFEGEELIATGVSPTVSFGLGTHVVNL